MKLGARAHDFGAGGTLSFPERIQLIKDIGYGTIQLAPAKVMKEIPDIHSITLDHMLRIGGVLEELKMDVSILGCYIEPALSDRGQRLKNVDTFKKNLEYAKHISTTIVGTETTHFPMSGETNRKKAYENLKDSVLRMAETAERENIFIGLEPVAEHTMNEPEITRRLIDEVGSEKIKVIFDPSNLLLPGTIKMQHEIFGKVYELLGDYIEIVHVKDFVVENGKKRMVTLGAGVVDFPSIFEWLKQHKPDIPLLRENGTQESSIHDIAYINKYLKL